MGVFSQLKQIKDLKKQAKVLQDRLSQLEETVEVGWTHKVSVKMNGQQEILDVKIDPELLKGDAKKLEDLIKDAVNKVSVKIKKLMSQEMMKEQGGLIGTLNKLNDIKE